MNWTLEKLNDWLADGECEVRLEMVGADQCDVYWFDDEGGEQKIASYYKCGEENDPAHTAATHHSGLLFMGEMACSRLMKHDKEGAQFLAMLNLFGLTLMYSKKHILETFEIEENQMDCFQARNKAGAA